jgi:hypothetical protein
MTRESYKNKDNEVEVNDEYRGTSTLQTLQEREDEMFHAKTLYSATSVLQEAGHAKLSLPSI